MPRKNPPNKQQENNTQNTPQESDATKNNTDLKTAEIAFEEQKREHHANTRYTTKDADACVDINEGIPTNPLPKEGLPQLKRIEAEEEIAEKKKEDAKKKDGMTKALDILEEYYDDTPPRDPRFQHDEE